MFYGIKIKTKLLPDNQLGTWSVYFSLATIALFIFTTIFYVRTIEDINKTTLLFIMAKPLKIYLLITGLLSMASGVAAFFTGILSILKHKDRSILVYMATFLGLIVILFILGQFMSRY